MSSGDSDFRETPSVQDGLRKGDSDWEAIVLLQIQKDVRWKEGFTEEMPEEKETHPWETSLDIARHISHGEKSRYWFFFSVSNTMMHASFDLFYFIVFLHCYWLPIYCQIQANSSADTLPDLTPACSPALYFSIFPSHPYSHPYQTTWSWASYLCLFLLHLISHLAKSFPGGHLARAQTNTARRKPCWPPSGDSHAFMLLSHLADPIIILLTVDHKPFLLCLCPPHEIIHLKAIICSIHLCISILSTVSCPWTQSRSMCYVNKWV